MNAIVKSALFLSAAMLFAGSALASSEPTSAPEAPASDKAPSSEDQIRSSDVQISTPGNGGAEAQLKLCCGTAGDYGVICWRC